MNESETLNRSFTIILAVHQPYSIMLHVTYYVYFKYSLTIHEENTKKISTMSETLYVIKFCSKFLLDLQNNYAIELMKWVVFEAV